MGQTWVKSEIGTIRGQKEIPKNGGVKPFLGICLVRVFITDLTKTQKKAQAVSTYSECYSHIRQRDCKSGVNIRVIQVDTVLKNAII